MDTMPLSFIIFGVIPEALLMMFFGLTMVGIKPKPIRIFIASIVQGIAIFFIRRYVDIGPHLILSFFSMSLIMWLLLKAALLKAFLGCFISFIVNTLIEGTYAFIAQGVTGLSYVEILSQEWLRIVYLLPKLIIQALLIFFCLKFQFNIEEELNNLKKLGNQVNNK